MRYTILVTSSDYVCYATWSNTVFCEVNINYSFKKSQNSKYFWIYTVKQKLDNFY